MFGIDAVEIVLIIVLAILLFGPEKMPEYSRKAARIFVYLKGIANNTQNTLRDQLGPEYADLELKDLNPKAFIQKHLAQEVAAIEEAKREIEAMKADLKDVTEAAQKEIGEADSATKTVGKNQARATKSGGTAKPESTATTASPTKASTLLVEPAPFDVEAT